MRACRARAGGEGRRIQTGQGGGAEPYPFSSATTSVTDKMKWTFKFRSNALRGRATLQNDEKKRKMGAVVKTRRMAEGGERREAGRRGNKLHICQQVASFVRAQRKALEREKEALKRLLQGRPTHRHNHGVLECRIGTQ